MGSSNKVAFVVLNYKSHDETLDCINSIHDSSSSHHVFLVDNSSNKIESDLLKESVRDLPEITLLLPEKNLGFAGGVNLGIRKAISEGFSRFFLLNNDAVLIPEYWKIMENAIAEHPGSILAPTIRWGDDICKGSYYHGILGLHTRNRPFISKGFSYYFTGCALAFDQSVIDKLGFLDEDFFMYGEDLEYCQRAQRLKIPLVLIDKELVLHEGSKSAHMSSLFYEYHLIRSHYLLSFKMYDSALKTALTLLCKFFMMTARSIIRTIRYKSFMPLIALFIAPVSLSIRPKN